MLISPMKRVLKFFFFLLMFLWLPGMVMQLPDVFRSMLPLKTPTKMFIAGGAIYFLAEWAYFSRKGRFWPTLIHEINHAIFAALFFQPVHRLHATSQRGGQIVVEGGNFVIALAPYSFPFFSLLFLSIMPFLQPAYRIYPAALVGFTYFFHLFHLLQEASPQQPDLLLTGRVFAYIYILFFNLLFLVLILCGITGQWTLFLEFLRTSFRTSLFGGMNVVAEILK